MVCGIERIVELSLVVVVVSICFKKFQTLRSRLPTGCQAKLGLHHPGSPAMQLMAGHFRALIKWPHAPSRSPLNLV